MEFDKSNSVFQANVKTVENIQGEALDFTKWSLYRRIILRLHYLPALGLSQTAQHRGGQIGCEIR